jgi:hypothetical protein
VQQRTSAATGTLDLFWGNCLKFFSHKTFVRTTWMLFAIPMGLITMVMSAILYTELTGVSFTTPVHQTSVLELVGFILALVLPIPFGMSAGGWIWSRVAKRFLGITREDMETLLLGGPLRIGFLDRANRRAIDKLFASSDKI